MRDYAEKPEAVRVLVRLASEGEPRLGLGEKLAAAGRRFGFLTEVETGLQDASVPPEIVISHLILLVGRTSPDAALRQAKPFLKNGWSVSLAIDYVDEAEMLASRPQIETLKQTFGDGLNFLRPDASDRSGLFVSDEKILDNAVCDTVRVKFEPVRLGEAPETDGGIDRAWPEFQRLSELYALRSMYLRSSTDGYIAIRSPQGFFITCTKTDKIRLSNSRISEVIRYDRSLNALQYKGQYLPSSDAVEASAIFAAMPDISIVFHTHASDLFTRNPLFADRVVVPRLPYGEPELGDALVDSLRSARDGFVIMEEHGEVFVGSDVEQIIYRVEDAVRTSCAT